ncbi:MAG: hypothetical protein OXI16_13785 [Chloroflexota bacterium]|nr:hypothetical protein [Chloroflexota bacterium]
MKRRETITICDWCKKVIEADAPAVHTSTVDVMWWKNGRGAPVASLARSYHVKDPDCYNEFRNYQHQASMGVTSASQPASTADAADVPQAIAATSVAVEDVAAGTAVADDIYVWGEAFGMTAGEVMSGERTRPPKAARRRLQSRFYRRRLCTKSPVCTKMHI